MPPAMRLYDLCYGHGTCPSRENDEASPNVFINRLGAHRLNDHWTVHCNHDSYAATGSPNVFVNGRNLCRKFDMVACGSPMGATHSPDVFVNDLGDA